MKLKRIAAAIAVVMGLSVFGGCVKKPVNPVELPKETSVVETADSYTLQNNKMSIGVKKSNGNIISLKNTKTGTDLLAGTAGGNFALTVDASTPDVFLANHNSASAVMVRSRTLTPVIGEEAVTGGKGLKLVFSISGAGFDNITVTQKIALSNDADSAVIDYDVKNDSTTDCVVVSFTAAQLSGVKDLAGSDKLNLFWPYKEGKLYEGGINLLKSGQSKLGSKISAGYPVPFSMQLLQVYNDKESFDYYVMDTEGTYKEFNAGDFRLAKEYDNGVDVSDKISLSATQFPYAAKGKTETLSSVAVGVSSRGGWYGGSDKYRNWLTNSGMVREQNEMVKNWTGMSALIADHNSNNFASYLDGQGSATHYGKWIADTDSRGIDTLCVLGWHEGGFDHMYPDYEFKASQGGGEAFKTMTGNLHTVGDSVIAYINGHISDTESKWSKSNYPKQAAGTTINHLQQTAVKKVGFNYGVTTGTEYENHMYPEFYPDAELWAYASCPSSKEFQKVLNDGIKRLRVGGVDGIWFDQIMEMPALLCCDASHGHKNPATAFGGGYAEMFKMFEKTMTENGTSPYLYSSEGICDAYTKYIDVSGMMWQRKLGARDSTEMKDNFYWQPQITRYTMPSKMLGIETAGAVQGASDEFARAFVLSNPLLSSNYQESVSRITSIYTSDADIFLHGRYMDAAGVRWGDKENVFVTVIKADKGKSFAIQVYNQGRDAANNMKIIIDLDALGIAGSIVSVKNLITGDTVALQSDNSIIINTAAKDIGSYKIIYN